MRTEPFTSKNMNNKVTRSFNGHLNFFSER